MVQQYVALFSRQRGFERPTLFRRGRRQVEVVRVIASGIVDATWARFSSVLSAKAIILLSNGPGAIALTVMFSGANRWAR